MLSQSVKQQFTSFWSFLVFSSFEVLILSFHYSETDHKNKFCSLCARISSKQYYFIFFSRKRARSYSILLSKSTNSQHNSFISLADKEHGRTTRKEIKLEAYLQSIVWQHKAWNKRSTNNPNAGWTKHAKVIAVSAVTSMGLTLRTLTTCFMIVLHQYKQARC